MFGKIYLGLTGKEAVDFLLKQGGGEVRAALFHPEIGYIDLVYGTTGESGYGLAHIQEKHPEIISRLHEFIIGAIVLQRLSDRTVLLFAPNVRAIISLTWFDEQKNWLVTAYEKIPD